MSSWHDTTSLPLPSHLMRHKLQMLVTNLITCDNSSGSNERSTTPVFNITPYVQV